MHNVLIRPLEEEDAKTSFKWRNNPEIWRLTGNRPESEITYEVEFAWIQKVRRETNSYRFAILVDNNYVGNIQITNIIKGGDGEYHIFIGEKMYWGIGVATLATYQLIRFIKERLQLKRLYLFVNPENKPAIRVYEKCGFLKVTDEIKMVYDLNKDLIPMVSVFMMTYNHEAYIKRAIESILYQNTNFDFNIVIGEDSSADKTRLIIKDLADKFPGKFKLLLHKRNIGAVANQMEVFTACSGKYIAICEGDDYWTDSYKLQKQVDFLEKNTDYGMVHTAVKVVDINDNLITDLNTEKPSGTVFFDLLKSSFIVTCTTCFRTEIIKKIIRYATENSLKCVFDYWLWLHIAMQSKIKYLPEITSAYRSHSGGVTRSGKSFFSKVSPIAVLDAISFKLVHFPEKKFSKKWELYINYCRALTASSLSWYDWKKYFKFLLRKPVFFLAFIPALWRKIQLRFSKRKP